ncbi:MAG: hypothetical protein ACO3L6_06110 [Dehalococcoidia bacterium]
MFRSKYAPNAGTQKGITGLETAIVLIAFAGKQGSTDAIYKIVFIVSNSLAGEPVDLTAPFTENGAATDPDIVPGAATATIISYADEKQRLSDVAWSQTFIGTNNGDDLLEDGEKAEITVWLMDRITGTAITANDSIAYTDGNSANGGSASGLTSSDSLVVKSTRFVIELTPQLGAPLTVQRSIPPGLRNVMNLN